MIPLVYKRFIDRISPSLRMGCDPLIGTWSGRIVPIPLTRLRVPPFMRREILRNRAPHDFKLRSDLRLTVIIPYRDREKHLEALIPMLKKVLDEQVPEHKILVVEQTPQKPFNRAMLMNVGVQFAFDNSDYFCFHDVDMVPVHAEYRCPSAPFRLVKQFEETWRSSQEFGGTFFGGVVSVNKSDFLLANGFSNEFWGWGKEDDEFFARLVLKGLVPHEDMQGIFREFANPEHQTNVADRENLIRKNRRLRGKLLRGQRRPEEEGFNNVAYKVVAEMDEGVYTKITVDI